MCVTVGRVQEPVKSRTYNNARRRERAAVTRERVLAAARELFLERGYVRTTAREIAARAGVSLDTVYAAAGRKPQLMLELVEQAISGQDQAVPAEARNYVQSVRRAVGAQAKIEIYGAALAAVLPRLAPLVQVLREAAPADADCARLWRGIAERRAANMRLFAQDLRATGEVRADLDDADVADLVWSTNAPEYYQLLTERGWTPERYRRLVVDMWTRVLLTRPAD
jgi:AcrR family transcriptional regulator